MMAIRTQFTAADMRARGDLAGLRAAIENAIPLSAGKYNETVRDATETAARIGELEAADGAEAAEQIAPNWRLQLGSLGSGNHFIEVSLDEQDRTWLFLHSGSRGVGNRLASKHIKTAVAQCKKWWITLPDPDLAYLVEDTHEFEAYIRDLRWAQHFAALNRQEMMDRVQACLGKWIRQPVQREQAVACHHNYTEKMPDDLARYWLHHSDSRRSGSQQRGHPEAASASIAQDSPDDYRLAFRSYDELVRLAADIARGSSPSPADAHVRNQLCLLTDDLVRVSGRSRHHQQSGHPCNCQSDHQSDCVADAARTLVNTLQATHPSAAKTVSRTWDSRLHEADAPASGRLAHGSESLPPQHFKGSGRHIWLSRKGAIDATTGTLGLIPGSMGTASYIVAGKGNRLALNSSPHGAGRVYSRRAAKQTFTRAQLAAAMKGIEWRHTGAFLDEIPAAYKPIDQVMADAADLVEVRHALRQIVNVKGE
jgi:RNA-splicing ligase RtcB